MSNEIDDDQWLALAGRFVAAFEIIATAAKGFHEEATRVTKRLWREPGEPREAVTSRVQTAEDHAREELGATDTRPIKEWATSFADDSTGEEVVGFRERQFIAQQKGGRTADGAKAGGKAG